MENHDIIVFVGLDAFYFGVVIGIGAASGVGIAFAAVDVLTKVWGFAVRRMRWGE